MGPSFKKENRILRSQENFYSNTICVPPAQGVSQNSSLSGSCISKMLFALAEVLYIQMKSDDQILGSY